MTYLFTDKLLICCCYHCSVAQLCPIVCDPMNYSTSDYRILYYLPEFAKTHVHWVDDAIQPSDILSPPYPLSLNLFQHQGLFKWVSSLYQVAKVLELQNQHQSFWWILVLISFRIDWFDLLAVQGTLKSLLQSHNSKESILWHSAFFMVQLSHPYMTIGKTMALTLQTSVSTVMSLLFNMLFRFVIAFLPKSKRLSISRLQSLFTVILEPKKIKSITGSVFSHLFATKWWDQMPWS